MKFMIFRSALKCWPAYLALLLVSCRSVSPGLEGMPQSLRSTESAFEAGAAKEELTPPWCTSLAGYGTRLGKPWTGIYDRCYARASFFRPLEDPARGGIALISVDLLLIPQELRDRVAQEIAPLGLDGFILCATHTHSGVGNYFPNWVAELVAMGGFREPVLDFLSSQIARVVVAAKNSAQPARFGAARSQVDGLNKHRRDSSELADSDLVLARWENERGEPIAYWVSFAAHPTVLGPENRLLSADYPGFLCREIEKEKGAVTLFLNAASAELAPLPPGGGNDFSAARRLGEKLAEHALRLEPSIASRARLELSFFSGRFRLPETAPRILFFPVSWMINPWISMSLPKEVSLQGFNLGDFNLATFPCDFGVKLGKRLKSQRHGITLPLSYADGFIGYVVDEETYNKGWYESKMSFYGPKLGDFLLDSSLSLQPKK